MTTLTNAETTQKIVDLGIAKAGYSLSKTFKLGFMGGLYIALAALGNILAIYHIDGGMGKFIGASIFPTGLMLTILVGGSLFTGDVLGTLALVCKKTSAKTYAKNLGSVWAGNFCGAFFLAIVAYYGSSFADVNLAKMTVGIAEHKLHLGALEATASGFLCNVLVAIAVWFALATTDFSGKILAIWFPIMLFVFAGFQHVVANMFYLNIGLLLDASVYNIGDYVHHFIFVTIGNFLSGGLFLPLIYKSIYKAI